MKTPALKLWEFSLKGFYTDSHRDREINRRTLSAGFIVGYHKFVIFINTRLSCKNKIVTILEGAAGSACQTHGCKDFNLTNVKW